MDKALADASRQLLADNIYETAMHCCDDDKGYLQRHIAIVAEYLTAAQKAALRKKGFTA